MTGLNKISRLSNLFRNKSRINPSSDSFTQAINKKKSKYFLSDKTISKLDKIVSSEFGIEFKVTSRSLVFKALFECPQNMDVKKYMTKVSTFINNLKNVENSEFPSFTQCRLSQIIADGEAYLECVNDEREQVKAEGRNDESLSEQAHTQIQEQKQKQIDSFKKRSLVNSFKKIINVFRNDLLSALREKEDSITQSDRTVNKLHKIIYRDFSVNYKKILNSIKYGVVMPRSMDDELHDYKLTILINYLDSHIKTSEEKKDNGHKIRYLEDLKNIGQEYLDKVKYTKELAIHDVNIPLYLRDEPIARAQITRGQQILVDRLNRESE